MEASFFANEGALRGIQSDRGFGEVGVLMAFDLTRERIYAVAAKVYGARSQRFGMTCCSRTFECVSTQTDAGSSARRRGLAGGGQGSG